MKLLRTTHRPFIWWSAWFPLLHRTVAAAVNNADDSSFAWELYRLDSYPRVTVLDDLTIDVLFGYRFGGVWDDTTKYLTSQLLQEDCVTPASASFLQLTGTEHLVSDYHADVEVDLNYRDAVPEYETLDVVTGLLQFCLRVDYFSLPPGATVAESINFHETIVRMSLIYAEVFPQETSGDTSEPTELALRDVVVSIEESGSRLIEDTDCDDFGNGMVAFFRKSACRANNISAGSKEISLALVPKVMAGFSVLATLIILLHFSADGMKQAKGIGPTSWIFSACLTHIVACLAWFASTWPIPTDNDNDADDDAWFWNGGNERTCNAQGFVAQYSLGTVVYTTGVLLNVVHPLSSKMSTRIVHLISWGVATGSAVAALNMDMYQAQDWLCWIGPTVDECAHEGCNEERNLRYLFRDGIVWICIFMGGCVWMHSRCITARGSKTQSEETSAVEGRVPAESNHEISNSERETASSYDDNMEDSSGGTIDLRTCRLRVNGILLSLLVSWVPFLSVEVYEDVRMIEANFWARIVASALLPCQGLFLLLMLDTKPVLGMLCGSSKTEDTNADDESGARPKAQLSVIAEGGAEEEES